ncbi:MAG: tail fiber domain-containing protein [Verrucomicrobia bacterium]|nr:tail fiber domain-containing protein [Verrucomicrobiota bacterium]
MNTIRLTVLLCVLSSLTHAAPLGTAFTYQGRLTDGGQPANGIYDLRFTIYAVAGGGSPLAEPITNSAVDVSHGLFTVTLDFGRGVFAGEARWLEIAVRTNGGASFTTLSPRQPLTPTPHALHAVNAGTADNALGVAAGGVGNASLQANAVTSDKIAEGAVQAADVNAASFNTTFWRATGNAGTTPGTHFLGTTDNQPVEIKANNRRVLRVEPTEGDAPNLVGGSSVNVVGTGVVGATIGGGGAADFWNYPYTNSVLAHFGTIGGGGGSTIQPWANAGTVGGGMGNSIQTGAALATIGGGSLNSIYPQAIQATIGGGEFNFIFFGATNATIGGGGYNRIGTNAFSASIGGGWANTILTNADAATVAGGWQNTIQNSARQATIGGGWNNLGGAPFATVAGGSFNQATHEWTTIGGGRDNAATNSYATVPGGRNNLAGGAESFAAGRRAKAIHDGSFVWADATDADFVSTKANQFLIRAGGGVGIGTNNPQSALHVAGTVTASGFSGNGAGLTGLSGAALAAGSVSEAALASGAVTSAKIADGTVQAADVNAGSFNITFWRATGNAGTTPGAHFVGTTDNQPLELRVNGQRALRLQPHPDSPNLIGGHPDNFIAAGVWGSTIGGGGSLGYPNAVFGPYGTIGGGYWNTIHTNAYAATIGAGYNNTIQTNAYAATIGGGEYHKIQPHTICATIGGGADNTIETSADFATIGGGSFNAIQPNADFATIPGGYENSATNYALAAGRRAKAHHTGAFVWADSTDADFASTRNNQFNLRATGGVRVDTGSGPGIALSAADTPLITRGWDPFDTTAPPSKRGHGRWGLYMEAHSLVLGMPALGGKTVRIGKYALDGTYTPLATVDQSGNLAITGTLSQASDRAAKENFTAVDSQEVLEKVAALPITRWNFKGDAATQHVGPTAQDFHAAFGLGTDDKHIATVDADGVALAAIQGLNQKIEETRAELKRRDAENAALRCELTELKQLVRQLLK